MCCPSSLARALYESESRPKGFSTMTRVQPVRLEAARVAARAASTKTDGGIDK